MLLQTMRDTQEWGGTPDFSQLLALLLVRDVDRCHSVLSYSFLLPLVLWSHLIGTCSEQWQQRDAIVGVILLTLPPKSSTQRQLCPPTIVLPASSSAMNSCSCALTTAGISAHWSVNASLKACSSSHGH